MRSIKLCIAGISIIVLLAAWWLVLTLISPLFLAIIVGLIATSAVVMIAFAFLEYYTQQYKEYQAMKAAFEKRQQEADAFIKGVRSRIDRERI